MKIIRNRWIPVKGFSAINLLGVLFVRPEAILSPRLLNHERIHTAQIRELGYIPFYIWYVIEWLIRLPMRGNAYRQISFEQEAYAHERDLSYLQHRGRWAFGRYLWSTHPER